MNTINKYRLFYLILLFTCNACSDDWLDIKTDKSLVIPTRLNELQALLDNTNIMNANSPGLGEMSSDAFYVTEATWNMSVMGDSERNAYCWFTQFPFRNVKDWNAGYERIFYANVVLEGLAKITMQPGEEALYHDIKGNALFHRAKAHFEICQLFSDYTSQENPGVPLRLSADINVKSARATVGNVLQQVFTDLQEARVLLPDIPRYQTRASVPAVFGLLARIYLCLGDYTKAERFADSCLHYNADLLDFSTLDENATLPIGVLNKEVIFHNTLVLYATTIAFGLVDTTLYHSYDDADLRKKVLFKSNGNGTFNFKGAYNSAASMMFGGIATDEIILIKAECAARNNNPAGARQFLNKLLVTRWEPGAFQPITETDKETLLRIIIQERRKELLFRGLRWQDLNRLNREPTYASTLTRKIDGNTYSLSPNDKRYIFPIPDDIIEKTGMEQNP